MKCDRPGCPYADESPRKPREGRQRWGLLLLLLVAVALVNVQHLGWLLPSWGEERAPATLFFQWDPTFAYTSTCETVTVVNRPEYHLTGFRCWAGQTVQNPYRADLFLVDKVVVRWLAKHDDAPPCWTVKIGKWSGRACPEVASPVLEDHIYTSSIELSEPVRLSGWSMAPDANSLAGQTALWVGAEFHGQAPKGVENADRGIDR